MAIKSISRTSIQPEGSSLAIAGRGFPLYTIPSDLVVTVCGKPAYIYQCRYGYINVTTPPCNLTNTTVTVSFKGVTTAPFGNITVAAPTTKPTVTSITPNSVNPVDKVNLVLAGTDLGTDLYKGHVFLMDPNTNAYVGSTTISSLNQTSANAVSFAPNIPQGTYRVIY